MSRTQGSIAERSFSYNGLTVRVVSNDPSHLIWLEEFLSPQFEVVEAVSCDCQVALTADTRLYEEILGRGAQPDGEQVDCFALERGLMRLPAWMPVSDGQVIFDEGFRVFYIINQNSPEVRLITRTNNVAARTALMRVVREFAMNNAHRTGCLIIHGSAFVVGERGVIIAGPKGAGKTTLLIHALRHGAALYLSNDRVVVSTGESLPLLRGMPTIVTVRQQSLKMFPHLRSRLLGSSYRSRLTLSETALEPRRPVRPVEDGRFFLSPAQFCALLEVASIAQGQVQALVFPRVTGRSGTIEFDQISAQAAADQLGESLFSAGSARATSSAFALSGHGSCPTAAAVEHLCVQLTSRVRCFECRLGEEAYQSESSAAMFIRQVMG